MVLLTINILLLVINKYVNTIINNKKIYVIINDIKKLITTLKVTITVTLIFIIIKF